MRPSILVICSLIAVFSLASALPRVRGTTLVAPWAWTVIAVIALAAVGAAPEFVPSTATLASLRFLALVVSFCPAIALLGAKRPQDQGWQFVVFTLVLILSWPAVAWLVRPANAQGIHAVPATLLAIMILMEVANFIATRNFLPALLLGVGQLLVLLPFAPWDLWPFGISLALDAGSLAICAALITAVVLARRDQHSANWPLNRIWLSFRDAFGVVWAARIRERINALAQQKHWGLRLEWDGFAGVNGEPLRGLEPEAQAALVDAFRTLLRRFVSPSWIDQQLTNPKWNQDATP